MMARFGKRGAIVATLLVLAVIVLPVGQGGWAGIGTPGGEPTETAVPVVPTETPTDEPPIVTEAPTAEPPVVTEVPAEPGPSTSPAAETVVPEETDPPEPAETPEDGTPAVVDDADDPAATPEAMSLAMLTSSVGSEPTAPDVLVRLPFAVVTTIQQASGQGCATHVHNPSNPSNFVNERAIDFGLKVGTPVLAAGAGTVRVAGFDAVSGWKVEIEHAGGVRTIYGHLQAGSLMVSVGQQVSAGTQIARSGNSGNVFPAPTAQNPNAGEHLHFAAFSNGEALDIRGLPGLEGKWVNNQWDENGFSINCQQEIGILGQPAGWIPGQPTPTPPQPVLQLSPASGRPGDYVTIAVSNFAPSETVRLTWVETGLAPKRVGGTYQTNSSGAFTTGAGNQFRIPVAFQPTAIVQARGTVSGWVAEATISVQPPAAGSITVWIDQPNFPSQTDLCLVPTSGSTLCSRLPTIGTWSAVFFTGFSPGTYRIVLRAPGYLEHFVESVSFGQGGYAMSLIGPGVGESMVPNSPDTINQIIAAIIAIIAQILASMGMTT